MNHDSQKCDETFGSVYVDSNTFSFCKSVVIIWNDASGVICTQLLQRSDEYIYVKSNPANNKRELIYAS